MSIWGNGVAENDDAADWLSDLADEASLVDIEQALTDVADADEGEYLEVTECASAIAAAAVLADLLDRDGELETERYDVPLSTLRAELEQRDRAAIRELGLTALEALKCVDDETLSELRDLWDEAGDHAAWVGQLRRIAARIARHLPDGPDAPPS